ncbi:MAG: HlyC/CorC family transporter [Calditrichaceae bacterium]|nr:hemolysin family protein [Calditrichia bacterium]NUQ40889.1 HlyC/CorC family transporter [Calditrichaceae bacterium]
MVIFLISSLTAIVVSFLCSLAEAVLLSLNPIRLETLNKQGHTFARAWIDMKHNIGRPIAAILILNTIAHTGGATIAGGAFDEVYGDEWLWLFSVLFTIVILFGTEIIPKVIGVAYNEKLAPWIAPVLRFSITLFRPVIYFSELISRLVEKDQRQAVWSRADIETIARVAKTHNIIEAEQESVILNAVKLRETKVESVMIPRERIIFLRTDLTPEANFEIARNNFHTRYPISQNDSVDGIIGYINFKEIIASMKKTGEYQIEQLIRPILNVTPDINLNKMLKLFIGYRHHLAVVKDAKVRVIGLVTLEDVVEEIVGEIEDEFDVGPGEVVPLDSRSWKAGGGAPLKILEQKLSTTLETKEPSQTLNQWIQGRVKGPVHAGLSFSAGKIKFTILQVRRGKAHQVKIELLN